VIYTRDVRLHDDLLYNLEDLDIGAIVREYTTKLIKTLELPEMQVIEALDNDNLLETLVVEVLASLETSSLVTPKLDSTRLEKS
jgi:hypothetical protein